jgi:putative ABC transport system ATP-binding protein
MDSHTRIRSEPAASALPFPLIQHKLTALGTPPLEQGRMHDDSPVLRGLDLTRSFGDGESLTFALRNVSLELYRGQLTLLMGPSGSGKSTLLAVLSGLLRPDSGQVLAWNGEKMTDIWRLTSRQRERFRLYHCGFIFQGYNLFPALTARQQLEIVLRWGEGTLAADARERALEMLGLLGLAKKSSLLPNQLSGGEKQRVSIGRALIKGPQFCFADEPTSALDWAHGEQVIELLRTAAHERGATILIVSHDYRIVPFVDAVFHLEDGQLTDSGEAEDATAHRRSLS